MLPINLRRIRDEKMNQLRKGQNAYAETEELVRLMKRAIEKENMPVQCDATNSGCWFIPLSTSKTS
ncbi:hypothetical protein [Oceanobacillus polygoni]|uniref:Uncharacterized protein n=1 Tax=Oceanobacillus polygoni TaxID=1235259 RepID=A0A9X0YRH5_9BACI|nr:hypothetical protein [Oceanobacillus polygoni]MBP2077344.1 hypothetical protein [Oceanobacillus polygoni]